MEKLKQLLSSKKFLVAMAGVVGVVLNSYFGFSEEKFMQVVSLLIAYIIGQGLSDFGKERVLLEKKGKR